MHPNAATNRFSFLPIGMPPSVISKLQSAVTQVKQAGTSSSNSTSWVGFGGVPRCHTLIAIKSISCDVKVIFPYTFEVTFTYFQKLEHHNPNSDQSLCAISRRSHSLFCDATV